MRVKTALIRHRHGIYTCLGFTDRALAGSIAAYCRQFPADSPKPLTDEMTDEEVVSAYFDGHPTEDVEYTDAAIGFEVETEMTIVLSSAHLCEETYRDLERGDIESAPVNFKKGEYGFWIFADRTAAVPDGAEAGWPEDLRAVVEYAKAQSASWVMVDRDASEVDGLKTYAW